MPSILIDIYKTNDLFSGLGQFSFNFAKYICHKIPDNQSLFLLGERDINISENTYTFIPVNWQKRYLPFLNRKYDLWHSLHQFPSHKPSKRSVHILTIHDLNFLIEKNRRKIDKYLNKLQKNIDDADVLTVISEFTKKQLLNHIDIKNKPIYTIYNGVDLVSFPKAKKPEYIGNSEFFFTIMTHYKMFH